MAEQANAARGKLWVIATPIGNLGDFPPRAVEVLKSVDAIAAEDTRHSKILLDHYGIRKPMVALHEHNEAQQVPRLIGELAAGRHLALLSDAGTPLISDPGFQLVRAAHAAGVPVGTVPGPCAALAALSVSGIATDRFLFVGFLPAKVSARETRLMELKSIGATLVFYEAKHRIVESLRAMADCLGSRPACLARELTKLHETVLHGELAELAAHIERHPEQQQGEFVVVVQGAQGAEDPGLPEAERVLRILAKELPASQAARLAAAITHAPRKTLYRLIAQDAQEDDA